MCGRAGRGVVRQEKGPWGAWAERKRSVWYTAFGQQSLEYDTLCWGWPVPGGPLAAPQGFPIHAGCNLSLSPDPSLSHAR